MASLQALEEDVEAFCQARAQALAEEATGQRVQANLGAADGAYPPVVSPETLAAIRSAAANPATPEDQLPRLKALLPFLAHAAVEATTRDVEEGLHVAARAATVWAGAPSGRFWGCGRPSREEADRTRRAALARAAAEAEEARLDEAQRRWEARHRAALALGVTPAAVSAGLQAEALDFLRSTEDGFRDVLGYALRRLEPGLRPLPAGEGALHDLLRLARQPLPGAYPEVDAL